MMNTLRLVVIGVCCFSFMLSRSQENSTWYAYSQYGDKQKITELKNLLLTEEIREEESPYPARVDTVFIEKRLTDSTYVIAQPNRNQEYALMVQHTIEEGKIKAIGIYYPSASIATVVSTYQQNGLPAWKKLTTRWVFTEAQTKVLEQAPGYDEVTREAMIAALSVRKEISPLLKAYLQDHPDTKPFRLYRFVETKAQHKFIALGYNPYKPVEYNFEKQFEGDEEVIQLLTTPVAFD